jgi:hypothetical protein
MLTCHHYVVDWQARDEVDQKPATNVVLRDQLLVDNNDASTIVIGCSKVEANILRATTHLSLVVDQQLFSKNERCKTRSNARNSLGSQLACAIDFVPL